MLFDCHVHIHSTPESDGADIGTRLKEAGCDGALLISDRPNCFGQPPSPMPHALRLDKLMEMVSPARACGLKLYPFYWIDPMEPDALEQVDMCVARGVAGFKVICSLHSPSDPRAMQVWTYIASKNKPILFHSGILYDLHASGAFNRPLAFEPLLFIPGLRFAMAHISWPWCDELVSLLGKWTNMLKKDVPGKYADFFIDTTPGTPELYREDALRKVLTIYEYSNNIMFGSDNIANPYRPAYTREALAMDARALANIPQVTPQMRESLYADAFLRFVGEKA